MLKLRSSYINYQFTQYGDQKNFLSSVHLPLSKLEKITESRTQGSILQAAQRKKLAVVLIVALILMSSVSFGNKFSEIDSVELKNSETMESETYDPVSLLLKGKDVVTDIPGILYVLDGESRTLVPVRFIIEELGASVLWDQETKTVKLAKQPQGYRELPFLNPKRLTLSS